MSKQILSRNPGAALNLEVALAEVTESVDRRLFWLSTVFPVDLRKLAEILLLQAWSRALQSSLEFFFLCLFGYPASSFSADANIFCSSTSNLFQDCAAGSEGICFFLLVFHKTKKWGNDRNLCRSISSKSGALEKIRCLLNPIGMTLEHFSIGEEPTSPSLVALLVFLFFFWDDVMRSLSPNQPDLAVAMSHRVTLDCTCQNQPIGVFRSKIQERQWHAGRLSFHLPCPSPPHAQESLLAGYLYIQESFHGMHVFNPLIFAAFCDLATCGSAPCSSLQHKYSVHTLSQFKVVSLAVSLPCVPHNIVPS